MLVLKKHKYRPQVIKSDKSELKLHTKIDWSNDMEFSASKWDTALYEFISCGLPNEALLYEPISIMTIDRIKHLSVLGVKRFRQVRTPIALYKI